MAFHVCYYHIVWATYKREPTLTPSVETIVCGSIHRKSETLNSPILAINCAEDHIHVAVSIALTLSVADWVKNAKGVSAREVNSAYPDLPFHFTWQKGYGVLTFGKTNLPLVVDYIARQKEHHKQNSLLNYLERFESSNEND